jgi:hypothetical protein
MFTTSVVVPQGGSDVLLLVHVKLLEPGTTEEQSQADPNGVTDATASPAGNVPENVIGTALALAAVSPMFMICT